MKYEYYHQNDKLVEQYIDLINFHFKTKKKLVALSLGYFTVVIVYIVCKIPALTLSYFF